MTTSKRPTILHSHSLKFCAVCVCVCVLYIYIYIYIYSYIMNIGFKYGANLQSSTTTLLTNTADKFLY